MYDFKSRCYFFSEIMNRTKVFFFFFFRIPGVLCLRLDCNFPIVRHFSGLCHNRLPRTIMSQLVLSNSGEKKP